MRADSALSPIFGEMTMADLDADLIAGLKLAKGGKKMFFAFIPKGSDGKLIVSKKKILQAPPAVTHPAYPRLRTPVFPILIPPMRIAFPNFDRDARTAMRRFRVRRRRRDGCLAFCLYNRFRFGTGRHTGRPYDLGDQFRQCHR